jgi:AcrR family transcriptional regulator
VAISEEADRRLLILEAAAVVISERGVDAARMADIAEQAGVSLGLVQHYFRHRERLLAEVFRHELQRVETSWRSFVEPESPPLERLIDYFALCVPTDADLSSREYAPRWGFWLELWSKGHRDASIGAQVPGVYATFAEPFTRAIDEGIAAGQFAPRAAVADVVDRLVALIDGLAVQTMVAGMNAGRMLTLLVDSLCSELALDSHSRKQAAVIAADAQSRLGLDEPSHA